MIVLPFLLSVGGLSIPVPLGMMVAMRAMIWVHGLPKRPTVVFGSTVEAENLVAIIAETDVGDVILIAATYACGNPPLVAPEDDLFLDVLRWLSTILIHREVFWATGWHLASWRATGKRTRCGHNSPLRGGEIYSDQKVLKPKMVVPRNMGSVSCCDIVEQ